jgi:hypothetical protein
VRGRRITVYPGEAIPAGHISNLSCPSSSAALTPVPGFVAGDSGPEVGPGSSPAVRPALNPCLLGATTRFARRISRTGVQAVDLLHNSEPFA